MTEPTTRTQEQQQRKPRSKGVFPVVPTIFDAGGGGLDLQGQRRCVDFMIDAGSQGLCILANFSEQFVLTDEERERVMQAVLQHVAGRVPVIVTTTHFGTAICAERSKRAQEAGAAMVMIMPPYHGATIRVGEAWGVRLLTARPDHARAGGGWGGVFFFFFSPLFSFFLSLSFS